MLGIKIPKQDFALKRQGGLMREGGVFVGHYGICHAHPIRRHIYDVAKLQIV